MNKLHLTKINPGSYSRDKAICDRLKGFNNALIDLSSSSVKITVKDKSVFVSRLQKVEEDFMSETFQGTYEDGVPFRLVLPGATVKAVMKMQGAQESLTIAAMTGDGYAVHFDMMNVSSPDKNDFEEARGTNFVSAAESKAEALLVTADSFKESNPNSAAGYLRRFLELIQNSEVEALRFEHVQNIMYGLILSIRLSVITEEEANEIVEKIRFYFSSVDHYRYENGIHVSGPHGGARRGIEVIPNFEKEEGYLVTIYNEDGNHPFWGNNIQVATKQMKTIKRTADEIQLRGFGEDELGNSFSTYALSIHLKNNDVEYVKLYMLDRGVELKYFK